MKRILLLLTLAVMALVCPRPAHGQAAVEAWVQRYNGPGNGDDHAAALAVDTNGNLFVTGYSMGSGSSSDYTTIKYSGAGVPLWTNHYNGPGNGSDQAYAVAVDTNGNVFVTGQSTVNGIDTDYTTIKYSNAGVPLWTNRYNGPGNGADGAGAIALDTNGNVFVTGNSLGDRSHGIDGSTDYATIKYSGAGVALWTNRYDGPQNGVDQPSGVAVDAGGNVLVTGSSPASTFFPDYTTIKYSGAGVPLWTNLYNGPGNGLDQAHAVAVDTNSNVFVTGQSWGGGSSSDYATIKYSGAGMPLWTNRYSGLPSGNDGASDVAVDSGGNVFVTGQSLGNGSSSDYATIKYSGAGVALWTNRYNALANDNDGANAMALDTNGNVFLTGESWDNSSAYDYATIACSGAGVPLWANHYNGPGNNQDFASAVAVDRSGNVFMTGSSTGSGSGFDYATIKYFIPPVLTVALTTTNTVALSWPSSSTGFTLQQNTKGITSVNWTNVLTTPTDNGTTKTVIVDPPNGTAFYRLSSP